MLKNSIDIITQTVRVCLSLGGHGVISVTANIIPLSTSLLIQNFRAGIDNKEAFLKFNKLHDMMFIESNPIPVKKALRTFRI